MPKVSLIIPVYNVEQYLERCIASIYRQSFTDYEAIFVNDGSTDNSEDLCNKLISTYPNMRLVSKRNGGLTSARLLGFKESCGQYISFIDSDDYLHPDYLKRLYEVAVSHNADVSMCCYYTDKEGEKTEVKLDFPDALTVINKDEVLDSYMLPQLPSLTQSDKRIPSFMWLRMYKRRVLSEEFFISERQVFLEDLASSLTTHRFYNKIVILNSPLYYYCINQGSLTLQYREHAWDMMCNLYGLIDTEIEHLDIRKLENRRKGFLFYAVFFALRNSAKRGPKEFYQVSKQIRANDNIKVLFSKTHLRDLQSQNKILAICYKLHLSALLYLYYKTRM